MPDLVISDKEKIKSVLIIRLDRLEGRIIELERENIFLKGPRTVWTNTGIPRTAGTVPHRHVWNLQDYLEEYCYRLEEYCYRSTIAS
jgi:hypothetical protein